jgi:hypothetical protein
MSLGRIVIIAGGVTPPLHTMAAMGALPTKVSARIAMNRNDGRGGSAYPPAMLGIAAHCAPPIAMNRNDGRGGSAYRPCLALPPIARHDADLRRRHGQSSPIIMIIAGEATSPLHSMIAMNTLHNITRQ